MQALSSVVQQCTTENWFSKRLLLSIDSKFMNSNKRFCGTKQISKVWTHVIAPCLRSYTTIKYPIFSYYSPVYNVQNILINFDVKTQRTTKLRDRHVESYGAPEQLAAQTPNAFFSKRDFQHRWVWYIKGGTMDFYDILHILQQFLEFVLCLN